ncbi:uncharacterized protein K489DRAFT_385091 [Dissoconium aciculare CBS 342.82]|uniref:Uncharacterized protein n=1 Tax=Dissoconium aciculare CBS 342.82 TaxID=1314786 RepID=A0A6J3LUK6_9PEZI|nr:uncharacterized protein K489DRAFT_385091 [Dissoconium aciculare CBS 342.82]KAF1818302.1 hypothetical protein K489DRAFT_385091 [Dissoconium aciculare CBS 342.82]
MYRSSIARILTLCLLLRLWPYVAADEWTEPSLFHGTSILIYPDYEGHQARNHTATAARFYCYYGVKGYLTFGWWLPAAADADYSHVAPDNEDFEWYEHTTTAITCINGRCHVGVANWNNNNDSKKPAFVEKYVLGSAPLMNDNAGKFHVSYFDREGGPVVVGTVRTLSGRQSFVDECYKALRTLRRMREQRGLEIPFQLNDICGAPTRSDSLQQPLLLG